MSSPDQDTISASLDEARLPRSGQGWRPVGIIASILALFGAIIVVVSLELRGQWRDQVLRREGEVLHAVAAMQRTMLAEAGGLPPLGEPLEAALETSEHWKGVLAVRLYDTAGGFLDSVPVEVFESALTPADLRTLNRGVPLVRFHAAFAIGDLFLAPTHEAVVPMLEINVPLPARAGTDDESVMAQFWIEGDGVAAEFAALDRRVTQQAGVAFAAGALLITGSLLWAFRRVQRANRLLRAHAEDLARANRELAESARTSAIGAITAHLMHGLRNPLAGLEDFVATQSGSDADPAGEWASARESTRRLRALVNEVQAVLSDVQSGTDFDITSSELCAGLSERVQNIARQRRVELQVQASDRAVLGARAAGIAGLVLANLAQNAIEASPAGRRVSVTATHDEQFVDIIVADEGPGLLPEIAADPFRPRRSTKPDGAGIGLAISRELARHAGGELSLVKSNATGAAFRLRLPARISRPVKEPT